MTDDRAKWLVIAYKFSSYKLTYFEHIYRYVGSQLKIQVSSPSSLSKVQVLIQVWSTVYQSKIRTKIVSKQLENCIFPNQTHHEPYSWKETQTEIKSAEMGRNELSRNDIYLQHRISNDKYDCMMFHVDNHNLKYCTNPITCNGTNNTSTIYSHL